VAEANLWKARDVIRDLMDFAGNVPEPNFRPVDLNQVVQKSLTTLDPKHHQAHRIETDLQPGLPPIAGHASQLHQVLINLMTNAFEAMPDRQGHLQINTRMICTPVKEAEPCLTGHLPNFNGPCILLEIIDNGKGMSPATAQKLFDPFFSTKSNGRGLGLAGVLGIAQRSGVGLTFTTEPGIGTAFRLYFKERRTAVEGPSDEETDRLALAEQGGEDPVRPTILLVDDDPAVCLTVAKQIDTLGYDCLVAESGELALIRAASAQHLSAAIIDLKLPGLSGWDTLTQLRNTHPALSAVMMSGYGHATPNEKSGDAPGVELLVKPFGFQSLKSALDGALQDN
jgi:CheY-like chemotaxis protein